jgi:hypothetical protein
MNTIGKLAFSASMKANTLADRVRREVAAISLSLGHENILSQGLLLIANVHEPGQLQVVLRRACEALLRGGDWSSVARLRTVPSSTSHAAISSAAATPKVSMARPHPGVSAIATLLAEKATPATTDAHTPCASGSDSAYHRGPRSRRRTTTERSPSIITTGAVTARSLLKKSSVGARVLGAGSSD